LVLLMGTLHPRRGPIIFFRSHYQKTDSAHRTWPYSYGLSILQSREPATRHGC
jgi:hypothetical protein